MSSKKELGKKRKAPQGEDLEIRVRKNKDQLLKSLKRLKLGDEMDVDEPNPKKGEVLLKLLKKRMVEKKKKEKERKQRVRTILRKKQKEELKAVAKKAKQQLQIKKLYKDFEGGGAAVSPPNELDELYEEYEKEEAGKPFFENVQKRELKREKLNKDNLRKKEQQYQKKRKERIEAEWEEIRQKQEQKKNYAEFMKLLKQLEKREKEEEATKAKKAVKTKEEKKVKNQEALKRLLENNGERYRAQYDQWVMRINEIRRRNAEKRRKLGLRVSPVKYQKPWREIVGRQKAIKIEEEIAKKKAAEQAARKAEEQARRQASRKKAEEQARKQASRKKAEEQARKQAARKAEEQARKKAEEQARKQASRKKAEEQARKQADAKRKAKEKKAKKPKVEEGAAANVPGKQKSQKLLKLEKVLGNKDPFDVFFRAIGVGPDETYEKITKAYKKAMLKYHPDKISSMDSDIQELAKEIRVLIMNFYESIFKYEPNEAPIKLAKAKKERDERIGKGEKAQTSAGTGGGVQQTKMNPPPTQERAQVILELERILGNRNSRDVFFRAIGIGPDKTEKEITKAYKKAMLKYHPDKLNLHFVGEKEKELATQIGIILSEYYDFVYKK
jgi:hypothetical protein